MKKFRIDEKSFETLKEVKKRTTEFVLTLVKRV